MLASCSDDNPAAPRETGVDVEYYSGGETTVFNATSQAFTFPAPNVDDLERHREGDLAFESSFVTAPAPVNGGLGPVFNNNACAACHVSNGRGRPPASGESLETMLVRLSVAGVAPDGSGGPNPAQGFGGQLNDKAVFGADPEASVRVTYVETNHAFEDGEAYSLRQPVLVVEEPYIELPNGVMMSARVAPPVFGRGLLEAIPEATLLALADPDDRDGDGISGRPNYVYDFTLGEMVVGRFGLKANQPTLLQQTADAYHEDMGVTNPIFATESAAGQSQHDGLDDEPEIEMETVEVATFYTQTLAVPARRRVDDPLVRRGQRLFAEANCTGCHVPRLVTGDLPGVASVSRQTIYPYTDMLLHDMGEGLADGRPDYAADGREWRTPPLWGIGLTRVVHGHTFFLHDGRARNLIEAIMWHGGEADGSREFVRKLPKEDRRALLAFLESL
jgi:CxxC motif-containing protein (DUF1111 family)